MQLDQVDLLVEQWGRQRPDLDASGLAVVSRILMLYKRLEQSADRALAPFGLTLWQFDVLAALGRSGPPFSLSPTQLMHLVTLSSGAMTNRLDRLEELGFVKRMPAPCDRRGVLIALTPQGQALVDQALPARLSDARALLGTFSEEEREALSGLLRRLLLSAAPVDNGAGTRRLRAGT
jgi:DNA-binding MarR family transcriptional regulator